MRGLRGCAGARCGAEAVNGACKRSVVQQLSTMPSWMFKSGYCTDGSASCLPAYPWNSTTKIGGKYGNQGSELVDGSCGQVARYIGRLVGHYTAGGHHDECGHWHASGLHYQWWGLSICKPTRNRCHLGCILLKTVAI